MAATMAQIAQMLIEADKALTGAKARLDALRAVAQDMVEDQAAEQGAAPTWKLDGGASVSLDGWSTPPKATIVDEHEFATAIQATEIPGEDLDRYVNGTITLPLAEMRELARYMDPWTEQAIKWGLTDAGRAWAGCALQPASDDMGETILVDQETGTVWEENPAGTGVTRCRPRLVIRRPGKSAERSAASAAAIDEVREMTQQDETEGE